MWSLLSVWDTEFITALMCSSLGCFLCSIFPWFCLLSLLHSELEGIFLGFLVPTDAPVEKLEVITFLVRVRCVLIFISAHVLVWFPLVVVHVCHVCEHNCAQFSVVFWYPYHTQTEPGDTEVDHPPGEWKTWFRITLPFSLCLSLQLGMKAVSLL